ncbi:hypothetical protein [Falsibacillus albus]|uniref:WYL domain-containing protein n=1 Tax=Falsibacillus albus TaxID=2478915 RepID=A0A3L7K6J8_9BACI|nr:hypothetical protein [Falsibacillus albus]RLQ96332.1 hypothetical protein D9X91_08605 [Falsibacillus albus]
MEKLLMYAAMSKDPVMLFYIDRFGKVTQRIIKVESIDEKYIKAYCFLRKQRRTFIIQNILAIEFIRKPFFVKFPDVEKDK